MGFKIPYTNIKKNSLLLLKIFWVIWTFIWQWTGGAAIIVLSIVIWLPISIWKTGLIVSDHIMKHMTND